MADLTEFWQQQPAIAASMDQLEASVRNLMREEGHEFQDRVSDLIDMLCDCDHPMPQAIGGLAAVGLYNLLAAANMLGDDA